MWRSYEYALIDYGITICEEWRQRSYQDTLLDQFAEMPINCVIMPPWFGNTEFHDSHKSNLMRKDPKYYWWPNIPPTLEYVWPI
jgi:hypothetical protein